MTKKIQKQNKLFFPSFLIASAVIFGKSGDIKVAAIFGGLWIILYGLPWICRSGLYARLKAENAALNEERRAKYRAAVAKLEGFDLEEDEDDLDEWEDPDEDFLSEGPDEEEETAEDDCFSALLRGRSIEKAIADEERRLLALYRRKDKMEFVSGADPKAWEKYQKTKTYRGLMWEIEQAEETIARLERARATA